MINLKKGLLFLLVGNKSELTCEIERALKVLDTEFFVKSVSDISGFEAAFGNNYFDAVFFDINSDIPYKKVISK